MRDLRSSYQVPKSSLAKSSPGHVKLSPVEMMGALDSMSKAEKKDFGCEPPIPECCSLVAYGRRDAERRV